MNPSASTGMRWRAALGAALVLAAMAWLGAFHDHWKEAYSLTGRKDDNYSQLARGFLAGHLSLPIPVDPRLLSADPTVRRQAAYRLDASLYHGKYYLYFGVVPAALFFLPYIWLTGQDPGENVAVLAMVAAGFLLYWQVYRDAQRHYFPGLSPWLQGCILLLLAFGAVTPVLLVASGFYEIPIAGGYLCLAAVWLGLFRAWHSERHAAAWLACASAAAGLAVGCRPDTAFALPALAVAVGLGLRRAQAGRRARLAAAALAPVALIGLALMAYNYGRFDSPFEFGLRYQVNEMIASGAPLARAAYFWPNLQWYYLRPPAFSPYFPYVFPMNAVRPAGYYGYETIQGQLLATLLLLGCGAWVAGLRRACPAFLRSFLLLLLAAFACLFLSVAFFGFRANRYMVDFQGSLILFLALAGGFCARADGKTSAARLRRAAFGLLAVAVALFNVLVGFQLLDHFERFRPQSFRFLAHYGNYPAELLTRMGVLRYGPVRFQIVLGPVSGAGVARPLLATGLPTYTDLLYLIQQPQGVAEIVVKHEGYGELRSGLFPIALGKAYTIEADLGSLYPPRSDPFFRGWTPEEVESVKTRANVQLDGKKIIDQRSQFYDAPPNWVYFGRNPAGEDPPFTGKILAVERLPAPTRASLARLSESGVWRLMLDSPVPPSPLGQPVLGSGVAGHGNMLLLHAAEDGTIRFGLDQWGAGYQQSLPMKLGAAGPHRLEIFAGPQAARHSFPADWQMTAAKLRPSAHLVRVWLDGVPVWTVNVSLNLDSYDLVAMGSDPQGFSSTLAYFLGNLSARPYSAEEMKDFVAKNLAETAAGR